MSYSIDTPYEEGFFLGQLHAAPETDLDPRWSLAAHSLAGTLDEFMRGFYDGYGVGES